MSADKNNQISIPNWMAILVSTGAITWLTWVSVNVWDAKIKAAVLTSQVNDIKKDVNFIRIRLENGAPIKKYDE